MDLFFSPLNFSRLFVDEELRLVIRDALAKGSFPEERPCLMLRGDFLILNEVRRELARTEVILERVQFGVTRGVVYFGGEFWIRMGVKRIQGQNYFDALVNTLVGLEKRLRRIPGVRDVYFRFRNVEKYGGFWRRGEMADGPPGGGASGLPRAEGPGEVQPPQGKDEAIL